MSKDDASSGQPDRGKQETAQPAGSPEKKSLPRVRMDAFDEEADSGGVAHTPALRLMAWLIALVLLLTILGWALGGGQ